MVYWVGEALDARNNLGYQVFVVCWMHKNGTSTDFFKLSRATKQPKYQKPVSAVLSIENVMPVCKTIKLHVKNNVAWSYFSYMFSCSIFFRKYFPVDCPQPNIFENMSIIMVVNFPSHSQHHLQWILFKTNEDQKGLCKPGIRNADGIHVQVTASLFHMHHMHTASVYLGANQ